MRHRLFGKRSLGGAGAIALCALAFACTSGIPGHPAEVMTKYVKAIQHGDFKTVYALNAVAARQKKYLTQSGAGASSAVLNENYKKNLNYYRSARPSFISGFQWAEKYFFPPSSSVVVGRPYRPAPAGSDTLNSKYESDYRAIVPVEVVYEKENAPAMEGRKIKTARYDCSMVKIREGKNVRVYSDDDRWYFSGCLIEISSARFF